MRILALETTAEACSVALLNQKNQISYFEHCFRKHAQRILPLIKKILENEEVTLKKIDAIAFSRGPGNFTGVRIGASIAQGLALGSNIPLIGISTLEIIAERAWREEGAQRILVAMNAKIGEIYWAEYQRNLQESWIGENTEAILNIETIVNRINNLSQTWTCVGSEWMNRSELVAVSSPTLIKTKITLPHAKDILPLAKQILSEKVSSKIEDVAPRYLRNIELYKKITTTP
ncbi:tRNA (adenosine(37)-N6)-threonylcarbamoyltransferase complex dimerization subunit type 1 TsaB [Candidatus Erwinia haradaeae]|uniref:tRNA threonylcarbamoyladenosine biosynthesis protein TsaB n=1 Tax=Candidatus Erwinia haradaeae TaxID=1922217 RepID=A0A803FUC6_9GAMM|nr:tRNA (adenosine(37)-N6)-threonylcarbamoyltransferase complex dimerization subunit type 1 TsaB [Candidatus Erwinia haradaeae]VFP88744.1 tRNA threonylcarbamoyladenosine biosynthesis protein TsaB [Candidatus Erwinia haradaeae]